MTYCMHIFLVVLLADKMKREYASKRVYEPLKNISFMRQAYRPSFHYST